MSGWDSHHNGARSSRCPVSGVPAQTCGHVVLVCRRAQNAQARFSVT